ncbi:hypothetical protein H0484_05935 [Pusillimonas sp. CC-YST705]|uniref:Uncharacterized protein n=1 Tax=Mesopusillimonas faecipullorum TaxID=2755040 RepID=A0ABS8CB98_9BURK|nr:hypothetical protein [Mesopusillimonas faecipullorum]MCB5363293.1 hypothetical protein [Mesopusillimonas faecipullorum]
MRAFSIFAIPASLGAEPRALRRRMLARLGLAWLIMMQVMMLAFPAYLQGAPMTGADRGFLDEAIIFMNWLSLVLTIPVVWYCAAPVWKNAVARLSQARIGMDVPVALGIAAAFIPSVYATWAEQGEVYFESVSMFVAFLLTARYLELCARQASGTLTNDLLSRFRDTLSQRADRIALWFTMSQIALALIVGAYWALTEPTRAVSVMVAMLVISCPCALAMAVPTSIAAAQACLAIKPDLSEAEVSSLVQGTAKVARQNLYGAVIWHLLMMPLAAVGWVQPWLAAVTMLISSLTVALNAWLLFRRHAAVSCAGSSQSPHADPAI